MSNLLLLLVIRLHLVHLILALSPHVSGVISRVVRQLLFWCQIHHICAYAIHEVLRVGGDDKGVVVRG